MLAEERRQRLLEALQREGKLETGDIAQRLGVSEMTIRRDLTLLERRGRVWRVHGGAQVASAEHPDYGARLPNRSSAKQRIGARAAAEVKSFETVYLDAGTTCLEVARALRQCDLRGVNILTHAVNVAAELAGHPGFTVIQVGGEIYAETFAATGPTALATLEQFSFDRLFLSAAGLHPRFGATGGNLLEAEVKAAVLRRATWVALVLDSSKWNRQALSRVATVRDLDVVISDDGLPLEARRWLQEVGVQLFTA